MSAAAEASIMDEDLYEMLGVNPEGTEKEIASAYRKKALKYHPDKNPGAAAEAIFLKLSRAYQVLLDPKKKADYDKLQKAKLAKKRRENEMDSKRRKLKEDLESRETKAKTPADLRTEAQKEMEKQIEKLKEEAKAREKTKQEDIDAARKLFEEAEKVEAKPEPVVLDDHPVGDLDRAAKVKWNNNRLTFTEEDLRRSFSRFGEIDTIAISAKKKNLAIISYFSVVSTKAAVNTKDNEITDFFSVSWATGTEPAVFKDPELLKNSPKSNSNSNSPPPPVGLVAVGNERIPSPTPVSPKPVPTTAVNSKDFESVVLMKLRQAEERKKLIEQLQKDQEDENQA